MVESDEIYETKTHNIIDYIECCNIKKEMTKKHNKSCIFQQLHDLFNLTIAD